MPGVLDDQRDLLAQFQEISRKKMEQYADQWQAGKLTLAQFEKAFKSELRESYIASAWTARGTTDLSQRDYGKIGQRLRTQYSYMHDFFSEIAQGKLTQAQITARAGLYVSSSRQILEEVGNSDDLPLLPAYPADGGSKCRANCKCAIESVKVENGFDVHWRLQPAEHCEDCKRRSRQVLMVRYGKVVNREAWG